MTLLKKILLIGCVFWAGYCSAQVKDAFEKVLAEEKANKAFAHMLLSLDSAAGKSYGSFKEKAARENMVSIDTAKAEQVIFSLTQAQNKVWNDLSDQGRIKNLAMLRKQGKIKVISRGIANEIELPAKINKTQSYSDFYLQVIRQLMNKNKTLLAPDGLDYAVYQTWEKDAGLKSEADVTTYRYAFIMFLYKQYNL